MSTVRDRLRADFDQHYDHILQLLKDAQEATRKVWHTCPDCKKRSEVEIQDYGVALKAAELWLVAAHGKAPQAQAKPDTPIDPTTDPRTLTSAQRQPLIAQLRAKLEQNSQNGDISRPLGS